MSLDSWPRLLFTIKNIVENGSNSLAGRKMNTINQIPLNMTFTLTLTITDANEAWSHEATKIANVFLYQSADVNKWKQSSIQKLNILFLVTLSDLSKKSRLNYVVEIKITGKVQNQPAAILNPAVDTVPSVRYNNHCK